MREEERCKRRRKGKHWRGVQEEEEGEWNGEEGKRGRVCKDEEEEGGTG